jgi:succinate dehydrogenase / fumarate reductase, cytochrome b subunit
MHWTNHPSARSVAKVVTVLNRSSVGLKVVMAVSGGLLVLYLVAHMLGNLKIFVGPASFEHYAAWLRTIGTPALPSSGYLWVQRMVLGVAVVAHIWSAAVLTVRARRARPVRNRHRRPVQGSYAARTMRWGGVIIALFVIYHVVSLAGAEHPYGDVVAEFSRWPVALLYAVAIVAVGFHLRHGIDSALRTLGLRGAPVAALVVAVGLCAGFLSVPFAVLVGLVR